MTLLRKVSLETRWTPRISYENPTTISAVANNIRVPPGVADTIPAPIFVNKADFDILLAADEGRKDKSLTFGLVTAKLSVSFADVAHQWVKTDARSSPSWKFLGGTIYLDLRLGLYIYDHYKTRPGDPCTFQVLSRLVEHELLHIADETDIVGNWLPETVKKDAASQYLDDVMPDSTYQKWVVQNYFEERVRDYIWSDEHNRRVAIRDAKREYDEISNEVRELQIRCKHGK